MLPRIESVAVVGDYRLQLRFSDGVAGEVDLRHQVVGRGGVFTPLEELAFFNQVVLDREIGTIVWPNGVDLDPDVLHASLIAVEPKPLHAVGNS